MVDSSPITAMSVVVSVDQLRAIHRDLDACQKVIWLAGVRPRGYGFDPAYCEDAQARLREIEALIATAPAVQTELAEMLRAFTADDGRAAFERMCREQHRNITRDDRPDPPLAWGYANSLTHDRWCGWAAACKRILAALDAQGGHDDR